jgi:hypothetical protein
MRATSSRNRRSHGAAHLFRPDLTLIVLWRTIMLDTETPTGRPAGSHPPAPVQEGVPGRLHLPPRPTSPGTAPAASPRPASAASAAGRSTTPARTSSSRSWPSRPASWRAGRTSAGSVHGWPPGASSSWASTPPGQPAAERHRLGVQQFTDRGTQSRGRHPAGRRGALDGRWHPAGAGVAAVDPGGCADRAVPQHQGLVERASTDADPRRSERQHRPPSSHAIQFYNRLGSAEKGYLEFRGADHFVLAPRLFR